MTPNEECEADGQYGFHNYRRWYNIIDWRKLCSVTKGCRAQLFEKAGQNKDFKYLKNRIKVAKQKEKEEISWHIFSNCGI